MAMPHGADRPERPRPRSKRRILLSSKPIPKVRVPFNDKNELTSRIDGCATSPRAPARATRMFVRPRGIVARRGRVHAWLLIVSRVRAGRGGRSATVTVEAMLESPWAPVGCGPVCARVRKGVIISVVFGFRRAGHTTAYWLAYSANGPGIADVAIRHRRSDASRLARFAKRER